MCFGRKTAKKGITVPLFIKKVRLSLNISIYYGTMTSVPVAVVHDSSKIKCPLKIKVLCR